MPVILALLLGCPVVTNADVDDALDRDGDGFVGAVHGGDDCNDDDPRIYPGAPDPWYDGALWDCTRTDDFDADGDGLQHRDHGGEDCDDSDPAIAGPTEWFVDADFDAAGAGNPVLACDPGPGWAPVAGDCDDANSNLHPLAEERCNGLDDDCDGFVDDEDPTVNPNDFVEAYEDRDGDGVGAGPASRSCLPPEGWSDIDGDCDDDDPNNTPGADERCDGADNDCDGLVDDDDVNLARDEATWYLDVDGDGFGDDGTADPLLRCLGNEGEVNVPGDCDDEDAERFPGADETCDGVDNDCDGLLDQSDPDAVLPVWYLDDDGDGLGDGDVPAASCLAPDGYVSKGDDCDDDDPDVAGPVPVLVDQDLDGFGGDVLELSCEPAAGDVLVGGDCDDLDDAVFPGAAETWYDGVDGDCDGASDYDADGDGQDAVAYGGLDCDDADPLTYDGAPEVWYDDVDQDCRGGSDHDADGDGFDAPSGGGADCDDDDPLTWPGAPEIWGDGIDQDCGVFDDLDVDMDGLPDMDGCTSVGVVEVPGDVPDLATAVANAPDCTEIRLDAGPHDADGLSVGSRRILVRGADPTASLRTVTGGTMFLVDDGYLGLANLAANGGLHVVDAGPARVTVSDLHASDMEEDSVLVQFAADAEGDLFARHVVLERSASLLDMDGGTADIAHIEVLDGMDGFANILYARDTDVSLSHYVLEGGMAGNSLYLVRGTANVEDVTIRNASIGGISLTDVVGRIERLHGSTLLTGVWRLHADAPGALEVHDLRLEASTFVPGWLDFSQIWFEGVQADQVTLVGNAITKTAAIALEVDINTDGSTLEHVLIYGNVVDNALVCWEPTPVAFSSIVGNTGGGVVFNCQLDHGIVAYQGVAGLIDGPTARYTDLYGNDREVVDMVSPVGVNGNIAIDPGFQTFDPTLPPAYMDVHLRPDSPLRDAGDPALLDVDGTVADLGAYGGPGGEHDLFDGELDGLPDGWELRTGLDPAVDDAIEDLDGDGLSNLDEFLMGTRPDVPDTDADQVPDADDPAPLNRNSY